MHGVQQHLCSAMCALLAAARRQREHAFSCLGLHPMSRAFVPCRARPGMASRCTLRLTLILLERAAAIHSPLYCAEMLDIPGSLLLDRGPVRLADRRRTPRCFQARRQGRPRVHANLAGCLPAVPRWHGPRRVGQLSRAPRAAAGQRHACVRVSIICSALYALCTLK